MTAIDTNILIDLIVASMPTHVSSTEGVRQLHDEICTTPTNIGECLRLLTHPKLFPKQFCHAGSVMGIGSVLLLEKGTILSKRKSGRHVLYYNIPLLACLKT